MLQLMQVVHACTGRPKAKDEHHWQDLCLLYMLAGCADLFPQSVPDKEHMQDVSNDKQVQQPQCIPLQCCLPPRLCDNKQGTAA